MIVYDCSHVYDLKHDVILSLQKRNMISETDGMFGDIVI